MRTLLLLLVTALSLSFPPLAAAQCAGGICQARQAGPVQRRSRGPVRARLVRILPRNR